MSKKGGLGKGLDALFTDNSTEKADVTMLRIDEIFPNKEQPRRYFDPQGMETLVESIREHGVIQPLVVRTLASGGYQIVAGERRWRASKRLGLSELPVVIREMDDQQAMEIALIENLQREDLNPVEEAEGYRELLDRYQMTQDEVAKRVGKSRAAVANAVRLLGLPDSVLELLRQGELSAGQAKAILSLETPEEKEEMAKKAASGKITVRQLESYAKKKSETPKKKASFGHSEYKEYELSLQEQIQRKVSIQPQRGGKGKISIEFYSKEELEEILNCLEKLKK